MSRIADMLPTPARQSIRWFRRQVRAVISFLKIPWLMNPPPLGAVGFRRWRSVKPIRRNYGWDSGGQCVDRYYIENFLQQHAGDIRGRVLEIGDNHYTVRFGSDKVAHSDVLHAKAGNPMATLVGDLSTGDGIPADTYECVILTQILPFIFDLDGVMGTLHRILAPGGVVLATTPGICQISRYDMEQWGDYWRLTSLSAKKLFCKCFPEECVKVEVFGNVASAIALMHGIVANELDAKELDARDPDYEVMITVRAVKPS